MNDQEFILNFRKVRCEDITISNRISFSKKNKVMNKKIIEKIIVKKINIKLKLEKNKIMKYK